MAAKTLIKRSAYYDSVSLMVLARDLTRIHGVVDASAVMATEANKSLLKAAGLLTAEAEAATPNDLVIAVSGPDDILQGALAEAEILLQKKTSQDSSGDYRPKSLRSAVNANPTANLAVISVAGRYATAEAWQALRMGLHVLLFSDNVSIEDEIALKQYASQHGLLLMGPGAGTALLNGAALGFANVVPPGTVGIVSAAGTGLQEVSTLLAKQGVGITQGIGTGGRDLKEEVGGLMMLQGLQALQDDPATKVIVLVSKPPSPRVAEKVLAQVVHGEKPTVVCFMGGESEMIKNVPYALPASTLQAGALLAAHLVNTLEMSANDGFRLTEIDDLLLQDNRQQAERAAALRTSLKPSQKYLRGLFSGGTLCYEAQVIWRELLPEPVMSNAPLEKANQLADSTVSEGHTAVDLGEEEFTVGRPHPMIDNDLRIRRLFQEAQDPQVAVIMMDVVLGYGTHPDPAAELGPAVSKVRQLAEAEGRTLLVIASVTGTEQDPQGLSRQTQALAEAGVTICQSNATAARLVAHLVCD